jgi:predicted RNA-binding protein with TRAM domain
MPVAADEASSVADRPHPGRRTGQPTDHLLHGIADEVLASERFQEVQARLQALSDRVARLERLERRVGELEARLWTVEDLRQGLQHTVENLHDLEILAEDLDDHQRQQAERIDALEDELAAERERVADLEERMVAFEGLFADRVTEGERAHADARNRDPREVVELGETRDLYVQEVDAAGPRTQAIGRIEGLVTFVDLDGPDAGIEEGDVVAVEITDHGESCAKARLSEAVGDDE